MNREQDMTYPIPSPALDSRLAFVGTSGSGKTYAAGTAVERLLASGARVVIVDPLDVWHGLRLAADGKKASPFNVVIFGGEYGDLPLNEHAGKLLGETVATMAESCIVSLGGLPSKAAERRFMLAFLETLYRKTDPKKTGPFHLVFDEADLWAPQRTSEPMLQSRMEEIVRRGRVKGFIPWLITQRPAVISKDVLSQADGFVAFKLTSSQDRNAIGDWVKGQADEGQWKDIYDALPTMPRGTGVVWMPSEGHLATAGFPQKQTFDSSRTPSRGEKRATITLKSLDLGSLRERLASVEAEVKSNDPAHLKAEIARLRKEIAAKSAVKPATVDAKALEAEYDRGYITGKRDGYRDGYVEGHNDCRQNVIDGMPSVLLEFPHASRPNPVKSKLVPPAGSSAPVPGYAPPSKPELPKPPKLNIGPENPAAGLSNPQRELLCALAWWKAVGHEEPTRTQVAAIAGWKPKGSNLRNRLTELSGKGLVHYPSTGKVALTAEGETAAPLPDTAKTLIDTVRSTLSNPQAQIFDYLVSTALQGSSGPISREALSAAIGWDPKGSNLRNRLTELSQLEIVEYPDRGTVCLQGWVFS